MFILALYSEFLINNSSGARQKKNEQEWKKVVDKKRVMVERKKNSEVETFLKNNNLCWEHLFA